MSEKPLLEMIGIDKTFGRQTVLKNCSLEVQRGETVVLIGPSGSGKSTLLRCVNMLSPADSGDVFFASQHMLGMNRTDARTLADNLLAKVRINERADHFPDELSGGQQQRVAIARALAMKPELMLYDEPTSALDPEMIREVLEVMAELSAEGMTSMVVTHEMGFARRAANKILFMEDGEIIDRASTSDFFAGNVSERAQRFLTQILH